MTYKLVAGLGNPGPEYDSTRHNAGFLVIDKLAEKYGVKYWKTEHGSLVAHIPQGFDELLLVKPQSYMNTSGGPISKIAADNHIKPEEILVIHDDLDLDPGVVRAKVRGGTGGHNGLKSITAKLGDDAYTRVRVGIGRPPGRKPVTDFVLQAPKGKDADEFAIAVEVAADVAQCVIEDGAIAAMNKYN